MTFYGIWIGHNRHSETFDRQEQADYVARAVSRAFPLQLVTVRAFDVRPTRESILDALNEKQSASVVASYQQGAEPCLTA